MHGSQFGGRQNSDFNSNHIIKIYIYLLCIHTLLHIYLGKITYYMTMEMLYLFQSVKLMFFYFSSIGAVLMLRNKRRSDEKIS